MGHRGNAGEKRGKQRGKIQENKLGTTEMELKCERDNGEKRGEVSTEKAKKRDV